MKLEVRGCRLSSHPSTSRRSFSSTKERRKNAALPGTRYMRTRPSESRLIHSKALEQLARDEERRAVRAREGNRGRTGTKTRASDKEPRRGTRCRTPRRKNREKLGGKNGCGERRTRRNSRQTARKERKGIEQDGGPCFSG